jgi:putative NADH-flavin reductase
MKIVVLGASGGCGRLLVEQAVERGDSVVAVGRAASDLPERPGVEVRRGDVGDAAFLTGCFAGADVVISALGHRLPGLAPWHKPSDPTLLDRVAAAMVEAAKATGVQRLMAISAGGVGPSWDAMPGVFQFFIRCSSLRNVYPTLARMEEALLGSGLDVCVARPSGLTDGPVTGDVRIVSTYKGQAQISRADVAAWMLDQAHEPGFAHRAPLITVTGG